MLQDNNLWRIFCQLVEATEFPHELSNIGILIISKEEDEENNEDI